MVLARSIALTPVVIPGAKSTATVKAVRRSSSLFSTMNGRLSSRARVFVNATQRIPVV